MLNTKDTILRHTQCLRNRKFMFIARPSDNNGIQVVIMAISEEEENQLNEGKHLSCDYLGNPFDVDPNLCYAYGELDLSPNSKDINKICKTNWFDNLNVNIFMQSEYDYETHSVTSDVKGGRWYETSNPRIFLPYLYACLNKPQRVVIFKDPYSVGQHLRLNLANARKLKQSKPDKEKVAAANKVKLAQKRQDKVSKLTFTVK